MLPRSGPVLRMNRKLVGLLSLACVTASLILFAQYGLYHRWGGTFANLGALLWATWLVLPKDGRLPDWMIPNPWTLAGLLLLLILFVRRPQVMFPVILFVALAAIFLRPRQKR